MLEARLELDARATLGEGPCWDARASRLHWVDIEGCALHRYDPATGRDEVRALGRMPGAVVPRRSGGLLLAMQDGLRALDPETGEWTTLADPEEGDPEMRFNDAKCDPAGRFWAGSMAISAEAGRGSLYVLDAALRLERKLDGLAISNGLAWSPDERILYHIDSPTHRVTAFDYERETGRISAPRVAVTIPDGMGDPDGMTIDVEGMLWIALWGGSAVARWDPGSGALLERVELPVSQVTCCAFGGAELDTLYITSARSRLTEAQLASEPLAGGLFSVRPGVRGFPAVEFAG
jgi:sugar lactone lactonase YvrE